MSRARATAKSEFLANHSLAAAASSGFTGVLFWYPMWVIGFGPSTGADLTLAATLLFFTVVGLTSVLAVGISALIDRMPARRIKPTKTGSYQRHEPTLITDTVPAEDASKAA